MKQAQRRERMESQIAEATRVKDKAAAALDKYEKARAEARAKAQAEMNAAVQKAGAEAAAREAELGKHLAEETRGAEARLAVAKAEAARNLGAVALEVTRLATERLIGVAGPQAQAQRAGRAGRGGRGGG